MTNYDDLFALRRASARGDKAAVRRIEADMPPTDVNDSRHATWYLETRLADLDRLERDGTQSAAYIREARAEVAREFRAGPVAPRPVNSSTGREQLTDAEMAELRQKYAAEIDALQGRVQGAM